MPKPDQYGDRAKYALKTLVTILDVCFSGK